jgi:hypothetical protein
MFRFRSVVLGDGVRPKLGAVTVRRKLNARQSLNNLLIWLTAARLRGKPSFGQFNW